MRWGWVTGNPFDGIRGSTQTDDRRKRFISRDTIQKVLDNCPDDQWRLIVSLSRFGGVRCPSETLALRWADVDFASGTIRVQSCKTEHHEGGGVANHSPFRRARAAAAGGVCPTAGRDRP